MSTFAEIKKIPRVLWILSFTSFLNRAGMMALPFLSLYLIKEREYSIESAGWILGIYGLGSLTVVPMVGPLVDRFGTMRVLLFSLTSTGFVLLSFPHLGNFASFAIATMLFALINEAFRPAVLAAVGEYSPTEKKTVSYAVFRLGINLGMSIGPMVGGFIAERSFRMIFYVDAFTCWLAALCLLVNRRYFARIQNNSVATPPSPLDFFRVFRDRRLTWALVTMLPAGLLMFQIDSTFAIHLVKNLRFSESAYGLIAYSANCLLVIFFEVPINVIVESWPHRRKMIIGGVLYGIGFAGMAVFTRVPFLLLSVVGWSLGEIFFVPTCSAYIAELAPEGRRGVYMGAFSFILSLCTFLAPVVGTTILQKTGAPGLLAMCLLLGGSAALLSLKIPTPVK